MSPSTEADLAGKVAVVQKLAVLLPPVLILLKRIHHIQLTSRETGDSRNQIDEKDSQITHHTIPTRVRNPRNARKLGIRQRHVDTACMSVLGGAYIATGNRTNAGAGVFAS